MVNCVTVARQTLTLFVGVRIPIPQPKKTDHLKVVGFLSFGRGIEDSHHSACGVAAKHGVRLLRPKIGELAHQAQGVSNFAQRASLWRPANEAHLRCMKMLRANGI